MIFGPDDDNWWTDMERAMAKATEKNGQRPSQREPRPADDQNALEPNEGETATANMGNHGSLIPEESQTPTPEPSNEAAPSPSARTKEKLKRKKPPPKPKQPKKKSISSPEEREQGENETEEQNATPPPLLDREGEVVGGNPPQNTQAAIMKVAREGENILSIIEQLTKKHVQQGRRAFQATVEGLAVAAEEGLAASQEQIEEGKQRGRKNGSQPPGQKKCSPTKRAEMTNFGLFLRQINNSDVPCGRPIYCHYVGRMFLARDVDSYNERDKEEELERVCRCKD